MRGVVVWITLAVGCGGGSSGTVCTPDDPADWPAGCDTLDCHDTICDITCMPGMTCGELDCSGSPQCRIACNPGSTCEKIDCTNAKDCFVACEATGTASAACDVTCAGSEGCVESCDPGSQCLLRCGATPQAQCQFDMCATVTDCGNGIFACNRACP
jgi:hypothetical protein